MCKANNLVWQNHRMYEENHDRTARKGLQPTALAHPYGDKTICIDNHQ